MHLGTEHLLLEATFFGFKNRGLHQCVANLQAAPVLENRYAADMAVRQEPGGTNREVALIGQKMHGIGIVCIPLQFWRYRLFGNKYRLTNASKFGVVLLPVGDTYVNAIHQRTPGFLV